MSGDIDLLRPLLARSGVNVLAYTPLDPPRGSLLGFCDLHIPGFRLRLFGCMAHGQGDRRWVSLPGRPWLDADGIAVRDGRGKIKYAPLGAFDDERVLRRFSDAAVAALDADHPGWSD